MSVLFNEVLLAKDPQALKLKNVTVWSVSSVSLVAPLVALRLNLTCAPTTVGFDMSAWVAPFVKSGPVKLKGVIEGAFDPAILTDVESGGPLSYEATNVISPVNFQFPVPISWVASP